MDVLTPAIDEILTMNLYSDITDRLLAMIETACFESESEGYAKGVDEGLHEHLDNPTAE